MKYPRRATLAAIVCVLLALVAAAGLWYAFYGERAHPVVSTEVIITQGATYEEAARQLARAGVISNVLTFRLLAKLRGQEAAIRAGEYRFPPHLTQDDVLRALTTGGAQVATWVTIPEGFTAGQIAQRLQEAGVGSSTEFARIFMQRRLIVDGARTKSLEGFLFPSTYLVPLDATPAQVADMLVAEFFKELPTDAAARARKLGVSVPLTGSTSYCDTVLSSGLVA